MRLVERKNAMQTKLRKAFFLWQAAKELAIIFERQKTKKKH